MSQIPIRPTMCATCPFRDGSPYSFITAPSEASRICHSTGGGNAINHRTGKPPAICRGARNVHLNYFAALGFISEATDEAWDKKAAQLGIVPNRCNSRSAK